jgi:hypothetical protein
MTLGWKKETNDMKGLKYSLSGKSLIGFGAVLTFLTPSIFAQPATVVSCQSINENFSSTSAAGFDLFADFPAHATPISEEVFVRVGNGPRQPVNPWTKCQFGATCLDTHFDMPYTRKDQDDSAVTWIDHAYQVCSSGIGNVQFCQQNWVRLVLTYNLTLTPTQSQCVSQATFEVANGADYNVALYAPAPANNMGWTGWMREETPSSHWAICDGKDLGHFCQARQFSFSQAYEQPLDDGDKARGVFFTCTNKVVGDIIITYPGKTRWCRAQVGYAPN